jgi:hypothetical protein
LTSARRCTIWRFRGITAAVLTCCFTLSIAAHLCAQQSTHTPVFRAETWLALIDGVVEQGDPKTHARRLVTGLSKADFRLYEDGHEVAIRSFDQGLRGRPVTLWLIAQCDIGGAPAETSAFMRGKTQYLEPARQNLRPDDLVGAAHWCDDGTSAIDLAPATDWNHALSAVETIVAARPHTTNSRVGELAMQRMIRLIDASSRSADDLSPLPSVGINTDPGARLPLLVFLYGDASATYVNEALAIREDVLRSQGAVYGLGEIDLGAGVSDGKMWNLVHYYSESTGGEYYSSADSQRFASIPAYIVSQSHLRYTLGFRPKKLDGHVHEIRVELTTEARRRLGGVTLRFRREIIPMKSARD